MRWSLSGTAASPCWPGRATCSPPATAWRGFREGLQTWSVDLDPGCVVEGAFTRDGGYEAMSAVLSAGNDGLTAFSR